MTKKKTDTVPAERILQLTLEIRNLAYHGWEDRPNAEFLFREISKKAQIIAAHCQTHASQPLWTAEEVNLVRKILFDALELKEAHFEDCNDRLHVLATRAANVIYWRDQQIAELKGAAAPSQDTATLDQRSWERGRNDAAKCVIEEMNVSAEDGNTLGRRDSCDNILREIRNLVYPSAAPSQHTWISAADKLPELGFEVDVICADGDRFMDHREPPNEVNVTEHWDCADGNGLVVMYWRHLPDPLSEEMAT